MTHAKIACSSLLVLAVLTGAACAEPLRYPAPSVYTLDKAQRMQKGKTGGLSPVYGPLAEQLVADFGLADKDGIGIDIGSGSGRLIIELCKRTRMHWINADINPFCFPAFIAAADEAGFGGRVSAIFADAQALPFKDDYADIIVSRGCFQFWEDQTLGFREVYRVLRPGGVAYIGRGFSANLPVDVARAVREGQSKGSGGPPPYEVDETERELLAIMKSLGIESFTIHKPQPPGSEGIKYGLWIEIHKDATRGEK